MDTIYNATKGGKKIIIKYSLLINLNKKLEVIFGKGNRNEKAWVRGVIEQAYDDITAMIKRQYPLHLKKTAILASCAFSVERNIAIADAITIRGN